MSFVCFIPIICLADEDMSIVISHLAVHLHHGLIGRLAQASPSNLRSIEHECIEEFSWIHSTVKSLQLLKPASMLWFAWEAMKMKVILVLQTGGSISDVKDACEGLLGVSAIMAISLCQCVPLSGVQLFAFHLAVSCLFIFNLFDDLDDGTSTTRETKELYSTCVSALPSRCLSDEYRESVSCVQQLLHESQSKPLSFEERLRLSDRLRWQLSEFFLHVLPLQLAPVVEVEFNLEGILQIAGCLAMDEQTLQTFLSGELPDGREGPPFPILGILPPLSVDCAGGELPEVVHHEEKKDIEKEDLHHTDDEENENDQIKTESHTEDHSSALFELNAVERLSEEQLTRLVSSAKPDKELRPAAQLAQLQREEEAKQVAMRKDIVQLENECRAGLPDAVTTVLQASRESKQMELLESLAVLQRLRNLMKLLHGGQQSCLSMSMLLNSESIVHLLYSVISSCAGKMKVLSDLILEVLELLPDAILEKICTQLMIPLTSRQQSIDEIQHRLLHVLADVPSSVS